MIQRNRRTWLTFAFAAALGAIGLGLLTERALRREREVAKAGVESQWQEDVRTVLYRMDQRFSTLMARAVARTERPGITRGEETYLVELPEGVAQPEGRLAYNSALNDAANDVWMSNTYTDPVQLDRPLIDNTHSNSLQTLKSRGQQRSNDEYAARQNLAQQQNAPQMVAVDNKLITGPLTPTWEQLDGRTILAFARVVSEGPQTLLQQFRLNWSDLRTLLLAEASGLFPEADLTPNRQQAAAKNNEGNLLASLPARLQVTAPEFHHQVDRALGTSLVLAWILGLGAFASVGFSLRTGLADSERQRRFTRAVTHELRTPLTTFQMYSDMLEKGMVPPDKVQDYLATLSSESRRLGSLVDNVLTHARLEDGRSQLVRESLPLTQLVERHLPALGLRCEQSNATLELFLGDTGSLLVHTEPQAVGQILFNLVDNACKYGLPSEGESAARNLRLLGRCEEHSLALILEDRGPGIPTASAQAIFRPFDRAGRDEGDAAPGVGLGLALCRDLARALGGSVELENPGQPRARFVLHLPRPARESS